MICPNCHNQVNKKDSYCPHCGAELKPTINQIKNTWTSSKERKAIKNFVKKKTLKPLIGAHFFIIFLIFLIYFIDTLILENINISDGARLFMGLATIFLTFFLLLFGGIGLFGVALDISRGQKLKLIDIYKKSVTISHKILITLFLGLYIIIRIITVIAFILPLPFIIKLGVIICLIFILPIITAVVIRLMDSNVPKKEKKASYLWNEAIIIIKGHRVEYYGLIFSFLFWILIEISSIIGALIFILAKNVQLSLICLIIFAITYIIFTPYFASSLVNLYRFWLNEEKFETAKPGINNGTIIFAVSAFIIIVILSVNMLIDWLPKSKLGDKILYYIENIDYNLKATEFTVGENKNKITFKIPKNYKLTKDSNYEYAYLEGEGYADYHYRDTTYFTIEENYQNSIESAKRTQNEKCSYNYEEFTLNINNKDVKAFTVEEKCEQYTLDYTFEARLFYPINKNSNVEIWITNYKKPYTKDELKNFVDIKNN